MKANKKYYNLFSFYCCVFLAISFIGLLIFQLVIAFIFIDSSVIDKIFVFFRTIGMLASFCSITALICYVIE